MIARWLPGSLAALALATSAQAQTPPPAPAPAFHLPKVYELDSYTPVEVAQGAPGTQPLVAAPAGDDTLAPEALAQAQAYSDRMDGHALLVWQGGRLRYERYGPGFGPDTRFETFSMHKSVLGLVYGAALRDHVIGSLDDPAEAYLPEWRGQPRGRITLRQLLAMESGLAQKFGDDKAEVSLALQPEVPPGTRFEYNSSNSEIAGVVLDRALKRAGRGDYADYLSKVLLKPLGAGDAHLWLDRPGGEPRFYAYLQMRARDWLRIGVMIDRKGRFGAAQVLPAAWIRAVTTPSALNPNYGLQMWIGAPWKPRRSYGERIPQTVIHSRPYSAPDLVFFDGFGGQRVYVAPSLDLVIVRIGEPHEDFDDAALPNAVIAGLTPAGHPAPTSEDKAATAARFGAMQAGRDYYDTLEPLTGAPGASPLPAATAPSISPQALEAAWTYAAQTRSKALLVWRDGALQAADYFGGADRNALLPSRSLAKPLGAIAVGRAIKLGAIRSLDQPVSDFVTEWRGGPKAAMTVRELLDMRSGLLPQLPMTGPEDVLARALLSPRHDRVLSADYPLTNAPGARFDYSNATADLVALVIERATRRRYAAFVSDEVLKPLGAAGGQVWVDRPGGLAHSGCCALLPAETWLRLAVLLLDDGRWNGRELLPAGYVDQMKRGSAQNPLYGLGVYPPAPYAARHGFAAPDMPDVSVRQGEPYLARDLFRFDGAADQLAWIVPSQRLVVLRLGDPPPKTPEWDDATLPNTILRGLAPPRPGPGPQAGPG